MKRITVLILIMIMVLTCAVPAFAYDNSTVLPIKARLYSGDSDPLISFSVTESITARNSSPGDPTLLDYDPIIIDNFASTVQVDSMTVTTENGYTLVADDYDFGIAGKSFSMLAQFGDSEDSYDLGQGANAGSCEPEYTIYRDGTGEVALSGHFSPLEEATSGRGATVTLTISAKPALVKVTGQNLTFQVGSTNFTDEDGTLEYSTDNGATWEEYSNIQEGGYDYWSDEENPNTIVNADSGTLYLRGSGIEAFSAEDSASARLRFIFGGSDVALSGNIEALRNWESVDRGILPDKASYAFGMLFMYNSSIVDASGLLLPQSDLSGTESYYEYMFGNCTALSAAPKLPATSLGESCYCIMFDHCTALKTPPALPARILSWRCYNEMFRGCTSLESLPALPATDFYDHCYDAMFFECNQIEISKTPQDGYVNTFRVPANGSARPATEKDAISSIPYADIADWDNLQADKLAKYKKTIAQVATDRMFAKRDYSTGAWTETDPIELEATYYTPNAIIYPSEE